MKPWHIPLRFCEPPRASRVVGKYRIASQMRQGVRGCVSMKNVRGLCCHYPLSSPSCFAKPVNRLCQFHYNHFKHPSSPWHIHAVSQPLSTVQFATKPLEGKKRGCQSSLLAVLWKIPTNIHEDSSGRLDCNSLRWELCTSRGYWLGGLMRNATLLDVKSVLPGGFHKMTVKCTGLLSACNNTPRY